MKPRDRLRLAALISLGLVSRLAVGAWPSPAKTRFVVYYGTVDAPGLHDQDVAVLDSDVDRVILRKFSRNSALLGYLSLGEAHLGRPYAAELNRQGLLLAPNPNWPDARYIDVRDARWKKLVVTKLVPSILERGFRGVFIDTLDSSAYVEQSNPVAFAGMMDAAVDLVVALRRAYPRMPIMVNRGYALLNRIAASIDMVLGESVHTTYEASSNSYVRMAPSDIQWQLDRLNESRRINPSLRLFSLDYWSPTDSAGIAHIYAQARANGLVPYVATIDLTRVVPRP